MVRYLELLDVEETTLDRYEQTIRVHIRPLLGHLPLATLDGETLDNLQAILPGSAADVGAGHGIWGLTCENAEGRPDGRVSRR
ncbi:tyrosine-type recombinase/integrase [Pseudonocardia saturnea]